MLANAGVSSRVYPDWKPFSPIKVRKFIVLHILQGLSPSPQIKMKFVPQNEDPINGSNICLKVFGRNRDRRHKMYKSFFACQDPFNSVPSLTFKAFPLKLGIWGETLATMSKQLVSRKTMDTNNGSATKKRKWGSSRYSL